jgi:hypothetical protein
MMHCATAEKQQGQATSESHEPKEISPSLTQKLKQCLVGNGKLAGPGNLIQEFVFLAVAYAYDPNYLGG